MTFIVPKPNSIIVGNLSYKVDANQLWFHFSRAGKIKELRLDTFEDGTCKGLAQIEFYTDKEVEEACKLNGSELGGRAITINFGHKQRTISTDSSSKKPHDFSANTVFIRGFDSAYGVDMICPLLLEHFAACDDIARIKMLTDRETGASLGSMFMELGDELSVSQALLLNGSKLGGFVLHVERAT